MKPLISVIVPIYNVEKYLPKCIESIINQTLKEIEIILIDDGSTDRSGDIADEYSKKDSRIKVIHKENGGQGSARNKGIEIADGYYIGFVDSDDWIDFDMYERLYSKAISLKSDMIVCSRKLFDENGLLKGEVYVENNEFTNINRNIVNYIVEELFYPQTVLVCNKIYLTRIIKENNIRFDNVDTVGSEDTLFNYKFLLNANNVSTERDTFYNGTERMNSTTRKYKFGAMKRTACLIESIYKYSERLGKKEVSEQIAPIMLLFFQQWNYNYIKTYGTGSLKEDIKKEHKNVSSDIYFKKAEKDLIFKKDLQVYIKKMGYGYTGRIFIKLYFLCSLCNLNGLAARIRTIL